MNQPKESRAASRLHPLEDATLLQRSEERKEKKVEREGSVSL